MCIKYEILRFMNKNALLFFGQGEGYDYGHGHGHSLEFLM